MYKPNKLGKYITIYRPEVVKILGKYEVSCYELGISWKLRETKSLNSSSLEAFGWSCPPFLTTVRLGSRAVASIVLRLNRDLILKCCRMTMFKISVGVMTGYHTDWTRCGKTADWWRLSGVVLIWRFLSSHKDTEISQLTVIANRNSMLYKFQ